MPASRRAAAQAVPSLVGLVEGKEPELQAAAARALGHMGGAAADALPALQGLVEAGEVAPVLAARAAIVRITGEPEPHVKAIVAELAGAKRDVERAFFLTKLRAMGVLDRAVEAVEEVGPLAQEAAPVLLEMLDGEGEMPYLGARALGRIRPPAEEAVPAKAPHSRPAATAKAVHRFRVMVPSSKRE